MYCHVFVYLCVRQTMKRESQFCFVASEKSHTIFAQKKKKKNIQGRKSKKNLRNLKQSVCFSVLMANKVINGGQMICL